MNYFARLFELDVSLGWLGPTGLVHIVRPIYQHTRGVCRFRLLQSIQSFWFESMRPTKKFAPSTSLSSLGRVYLRMQANFKIWNL